MQWPRLISSGNFGKVYKGLFDSDKNGKLQVAMKTLDGKTG